MKKIFFLLSGIFLFYGCAANTGVVPTEKGTFMVSRQAAGLFDSSGLKAESINEASRFCENSGRELQVISVRESQPPYYILAEHPKTEIEFMCAD